MLTNAILLILGVALLVGIATFVQIRDRRQSSPPRSTPDTGVDDPRLASALLGKEAGLMTSTHRG
jgi:hypothetical protein